jgi:hypothetical protein
MKLALFVSRHAEIETAAQELSSYDRAGPIAVRLNKVLPPDLLRSVSRQ